MTKSLFFILFASMFPLAAYAEYRAYELAITDKTTSQSRSIISTLDDIQYVGYYPIRAEETIAIKDTWMCWKRSDYFQPICPNPRGLASQPSAERAPSSEASTAASPTAPTSKTDSATPTSP